MRTILLCFALLISVVTMPAQNATPIYNLQRTNTVRPTNWLAVVAYPGQTNGTKRINISDLLDSMFSFTNWPSTSVTNAIGVVKQNGTNVTTSATALDFITGSNTVVLITNNSGTVSVQVNASASGGEGSTNLATLASGYGTFGGLTVTNFIGGHNGQLQLTNDVFVGGSLIVDANFAMEGGSVNLTQTDVFLEGDLIISGGVSGGISVEGELVIPSGGFLPESTNLVSGNYVSEISPIAGNDRFIVHDVSTHNIGWGSATNLMKVMGTYSGAIAYYHADGTWRGDTVSDDNFVIDPATFQVRIGATDGGAILVYGPMLGGNVDSLTGDTYSIGRTNRYWLIRGMNLDSLTNYTSVGFVTNQLNVTGNAVHSGTNIVSGSFRLPSIATNTLLFIGGQSNVVGLGLGANLSISGGNLTASGGAASTNVETFASGYIGVGNQRVTNELSFADGQFTIGTSGGYFQIADMVSGALALAVNTNTGAISIGTFASSPTVVVNAPLSSGAFDATFITPTEVAASRALATDAQGIVTNSQVTLTELNYVAGVSSAIQTQLDGKMSITEPIRAGQLEVRTNAYIGSLRVTNQSAFVGAATFTSVVTNYDRVWLVERINQTDPSFAATFGDLRGATLIATNNVRLPSGAYSANGNMTVGWTNLGVATNVTFVLTNGPHSGSWIPGAAGDGIATIAFASIPSAGSPADSWSLAIYNTNLTALTVYWLSDFDTRGNAPVVLQGPSTNLFDIEFNGTNTYVLSKQELTAPLSSGPILLQTNNNFASFGTVHIRTNLHVNTITVTNAVTIGSTNVIAELATKQASSINLSNWANFSTNVVSTTASNATAAILTGLTQTNSFWLDAGAMRGTHGSTAEGGINGATVGYWTNSISVWDVWDFDDTTNEAVQAKFSLPAGFNGLLGVDIHFVSTNTAILGSSNIVWQVAMSPLATNNTPGGWVYFTNSTHRIFTSNMLQIATLPLVTLTNYNPRHLIDFRIARFGTNTADVLVGDSRLAGARISFTTTNANGGF